MQLALMRLAVAALLCACGAGGARPNAGATSEHKAGAAPDDSGSVRSVRLTEVTTTALSRSVVVSGTLLADERVAVSAKISGRLLTIAVDLGSPVQQGASIAQLEPTDYQLRVEQAASALEQARALLGLPGDGQEDDVDPEQTSGVREARATLQETRARLARARTLVEQKLIAPAEFDASESAFVRAESGLQSALDEVRNRKAMLRQRRFELRLARQQLADTTIRAPFSGVVQERLATVGEYLTAGAPIATLVRVDPLRVRVEIPERDAADVRVGQAVRVLVQEGAAPRVGRIVRIAPALAEQSRTLSVEGELANPGDLRPGSFVRAEIDMGDETQVTAVPANALVHFAGIEKVVVIKDGRAVEKEIKTGRHTAQWVEVLSGVEVGEAVVVEPGNLQQGQRVQIASTS